MSDGAPRFDCAVVLRAARRIARLSQRELSAKAGVPLATLSRIECGQTRDPQVSTMWALLRAADARLAVVSSTGHELPAHPWEDYYDYAGRHFPAHLELYRVSRPYEPFPIVEWWGWSCAWAWRRGARIPWATFVRQRPGCLNPPVDPVTGRTPPPPRAIEPPEG